MHLTPETISNFINSQFPEFYKEEGEDFIQFVKAYFEWLEQEGPIHKTRNLLSYRDLDTTLDTFLDSFIKKYMHGIPPTIIGNRKLLQKHILDVYRSKGSIQGLKLLFRLLYNEEVEVYIPSIDILKPSDASWIQRRYIEVGDSEYFSSYQGKKITGGVSGATAYVDTAEKIFIGNGIVFALFINTIEGNFQVGEKIYHDDISNINASTILGSSKSFNVKTSSIDHQIGDTLTANTTNGKSLKVIVSNTVNTTGSTGYIVFELVNGGFGYSLEYGNVTISYDGATTGQDASFYYTIANTQPYYIDVTEPYINTLSSVALNATPFSSGNFNDADINTIISDALTLEVINVGKIDSLTAIVPGTGYDGSVTVTVRDEKIAPFSINDETNGGIWGDNAVVRGYVQYGAGLAREIKLIDSGFNYYQDTIDAKFYNLNYVKVNLSNLSGTFEVDEIVINSLNSFGKVVEANSTVAILSNYTGEFFTANEGIRGVTSGATANVSSIIVRDLTADINLDGVGIAEGFWQDTKSHLSSDKYIQDSYYYQEYSYDVKSNKALYKYRSILKDVLHPTGNELFGKLILGTLEENLLIAESTTIDNFDATNSFLDVSFWLYSDPDNPAGQGSSRLA